MKQFTGEKKVGARVWSRPLANELLHLPDKPAGVGRLARA
jgi:hypothetical protein